MWNVLKNLQTPQLPYLVAVSTIRSARVYWSLWTTLLFLILIWGVYWTNDVYALGLRRFGNHPRDLDWWQGIFTYPFLHSDFDHLWNNTATFFTLNILLFYFYQEISGRIWLLLYVLSGAFLWLFAAGGNHIGASGLIYGLAAFLFVSGLIRRNRLLLRVSLVVVFLYGGMVWWMLPIDSHISWEGHLSGAFAGLLLAILFRNKGPNPEQFESDHDLPDDELPEWWTAMHREPQASPANGETGTGGELRSQTGSGTGGELRSPGRGTGSGMGWTETRTTDSPPF